MCRTRTLVLSLLVAVAFAATRLTGDESGKTEPKTENRQIGTWKLVSAKYDGQVFELPQGTTTVKHVTPVQFMWASYDGDGTVARAAGGRYTLKGEVYEETPEYGISGDFELIKGK